MLNKPAAKASFVWKWCISLWVPWKRRKLLASGAIYFSFCVFKEKETQSVAWIKRSSSPCYPSLIQRTNPQGGASRMLLWILLPFQLKRNIISCSCKGVGCTELHKIMYLWLSISLSCFSVALRDSAAYQTAEIHTQVILWPNFLPAATTSRYDLCWVIEQWLRRY